MTTEDLVTVTPANVYVGMRVVRGKGWEWGDQDGHGAGTIVRKESKHDEHDNWWIVSWDLKEGVQKENSYRVGEYKYSSKGTSGDDYRPYYDLAILDDEFQEIEI